MSKINLTEQEIQTVIEAINNQTEVPSGLLKKLSPSFFEKLAEDAVTPVATLIRNAYPTIEYAGKRSETRILTFTSLMGGNAPLEIVRFFEGGKQKEQQQLELFEKAKESGPDNGNWKNMVVQGDNLQFLKTCYLNQNPLIKDKVKGKVKLIYIDPPFATKSDFTGSSGEASYSDKVARAEFLEALRERLIFLREILADDGTIYVHLDLRMIHYVKIIMDEIFGKTNFRNEIVWCYTGPSRQKKDFPDKHESILRYSKTGNYLFNKDELRVPYAKSNLATGSTSAVGRASDDKLKELDKRGKLVEDWWSDIATIGYKHNEILKYPTQKPEALIERIIRASSDPTDLIIDVFAGSGTTAAVAEKLGRRWIVCDFGKHAVYVIQKRLLEIFSSDALNAKESYGKPAKPFCVVSVGAYDFSKIMNLRENKDIYIQFVCGLFNINEIDKGLSDKYHLTHIYGEKEGDPVEIYPVWEDVYLKEVRIDEGYLKGIIDQSGGKLSGDYYIITPETCTTVGNTEMVNARGEKVTFHLLSFPYKVLEEFARTQHLQEQPSSDGDINNLISSVGFYFNEKVETDLEFTKNGLKITHFDTNALDSSGHKFEGLDGLAMVLVDKDYDGEVFKMEEAVYRKDIKKDGSFTIDGLTDTVGVIIIDKHGNESDLIVLDK